MAEVRPARPFRLTDAPTSLSRYIDKEKGRRSDVPHNYIYNRQLDNLEILTGYHVKRAIFECVTNTAVSSPT